MIAYLHAETLKRSAGRSIVASSAYISGERETNEYTASLMTTGPKAASYTPKSCSHPMLRSLSIPPKNYGPVWNALRRVRRPSWG